jgi:hypothetical protein
MKMLYNRCTGIYKFGNNTYPLHIRCRSNSDHTFGGEKCVLWAGKYGTQIEPYRLDAVVGCRICEINITILHHIMLMCKACKVLEIK